MKKLTFTPIAKTILITLAVNIFFLLVVLALQGSLPPLVPLFFGRPLGEEQLVPKIYLVVPLAFSILIVLINTLLLKLIREDLLQKILLATTFLVTALSFVTIFQVIRLVGNIF